MYTIQLIKLDNSMPYCILYVGTSSMLYSLLTNFLKVSFDAIKVFDVLSIGNSITFNVEGTRVIIKENNY